MHSNIMLSASNKNQKIYQKYSFFLETNFNLLYKSERFHFSFYTEIKILYMALFLFRFYQQILHNIMYFLHLGANNQIDLQKSLLKLETTSSVNRPPAPFFLGGGGECWPILCLTFPFSMLRYEENFFPLINVMFYQQLRALKFLSAIVLKSCLKNLKSPSLSGHSTYKSNLLTAQ